jgi:hypothetical protein
VILRTDGYLEDAVVLAGSLRRSPSAEAELRGYEVDSLLTIGA